MLSNEPKDFGRDKSELTFDKSCEIWYNKLVTLLRERYGFDRHRSAVQGDPKVTSSQKRYQLNITDKQETNTLAFAA